MRGLSKIGVGVCVLAAVVIFAAGPRAQVSPTRTARPQGISQERLQRLDVAMQAAVDEKQVAGVVTLVMRGGKVVQHKAFGMADREQKRAMQLDTIFRLASASKIVTTVAIMQLVEEGKLLVTDPISKYIPAFRNTTVAVPAPANAPPGTAPFTIVPAKRQITIHDVLTKTVGIAYPSGPTRSLYEEAGFHQWYFADNAVPMCTMMERLAKLPFHAQPGERWMNGYTSDILGCVIEKVSGQTLDAFERSRIFDPLKMIDTYFFVPKAKANRLAAVYRVDSASGLTRAEGRWTDGQGEYIVGDSPGVAFSGGAGLLTTAADYGRFLQMLLNGGELDGARILSPKSIEIMTANHVGTLYKNGTMGFGFNVEVTLEKGGADRLGSVGDFGWQGAYFPRYLVDPKEQMVSLFLAQLGGYGGSSDLHDKFLNLVYQSIEHSSGEVVPVPRTQQ